MPIWKRDESSLEASLHWLQEESGWDSTPDFQCCKYSWDESNPKRLSHKLYQNTHRFREGLENPESPCILAHILLAAGDSRQGVPEREAQRASSRCSE